MEHDLKRALFLLSLMCGPAAAWGPNGHAIVADIAEAHLTPAAAAQVRELLAPAGDQHLAQIASWADSIRPDHKQTEQWHFVNIPLQAGGYIPTRDCAGGECVVAAIGRFNAVLSDRSRSNADRLIALEFLVHFVGDIHQPLHAANNGDFGGLRIHVAFFERETNLHAIWDDQILEKKSGLGVGRNYSIDLSAAAAEARRLDAGIEPVDRQQWAQPLQQRLISEAAAGWANEAHALAPMAYQNLPQARKPDTSSAYEEKHWPVVARQLERAGVRLAEVLNGALQ